MRDVGFEAGVLRGGLLLGLVHEREVPDWASSVLGVSPSLDGALADVCLAPVELSAMRDVLYPLCRGVEVTRIATALLTLCGVDPVTIAKPVRDRLQQLHLLRFEYRLPEQIAAGIRGFEQREMIASGGGKSHGMPSGEELTAWLRSARQPAYFRVYFAAEGEAAAFMAALSSKLARDPGDGNDSETSPRGWIHRPADGAASAHVVLNEPAWIVAAREFAPLPAASRIPGEPPLPA